MTDSPMSPPRLPDGFVCFVKIDCPTCVEVEPVLAELDAVGKLTCVYSQDDPGFPAGLTVVDDTSLEVSWHHDIETVPTVIKVVDGHEVDRIVGWSRDVWAAFTGQDGLGLEAGLPDFRPGCGSLSVDPDRVAALEATFGDGISSRRVDFATAEDEVEAMYDRGWSDGLPLVPPTPNASRDARGHDAARRRHRRRRAPEPCGVHGREGGHQRGDGRVQARVPAGRARRRRGCVHRRVQHARAARHHHAGRTSLIVNGPIRNAIGMNSRRTCSARATAPTARSGGRCSSWSATSAAAGPGRRPCQPGQPGQGRLLFRRGRRGLAVGVLGGAAGFAPEQSTVTVFAGEGPRCVFDQLSRDADEPRPQPGHDLVATTHPKLALGFDGVLVISPEHGARFARPAGPSKSSSTS